MHKLKDGKKIPLTQQEIDNIQAEWAAASAAYEKERYKHQRREAYKDPMDYIDDLWHAIDQGKDLKLSEFYTHRKAVKDAYPKPGAQ